MPRIVFMGTPPFAVRSLEACLDVGTVVAVVTQPDKPKGRGHELAFSAVKTFALEKGLPVLQPVRVRPKDGSPDFADELRALEADVAVVTAYGKILPKAVLDAPKHGCVNVHASLLPRFRGAAPIQWAVAHGDAVTGVCLMKMDEGMDTGPVIDRAELPIAATDTAASLHDSLALLGGTVLRRSLQRYLDGQLKPVAQSTEGVVMAPMITKNDGALDFTKPASVLERRMRAFTPWPGAFTTLDGALFKVHAASAGSNRGTPGTILSLSAEGIEVACGEGSLLLTSVQAEGKRVMKASEFLAGNKKLTVGAAPFVQPART